jgi:hypothetical protein
VAQIKITLATEAGELDSVVVSIIHDEDGVREALIAWLTEGQHILTVGDTISIEELED